MNVSDHLALPNAPSRRMQSSVSGAVYDISVWCPPTRVDSELLPVVYVLDGPDFFCTIVGAIARASRRPDATAVVRAIVVGIARAPVEDGPAGGSTAGRHEDYTAGPSAEEPNPERRVGGADSFLAFLETELIPSIERELPADPTRRVLFGHSLAGYFALHVLATRSYVFQTYIAVSPSIWWNEAALRAGAAHVEPPARVVIAVGEWEGELPPWQRDSPSAQQIIVRRGRRGMIERARRFSTELGQTLGDDNVAFHLFPDEDHASVVLVAIARALRFALRTGRGSQPGQIDRDA